MNKYIEIAYECDDQADAGIRGGGPGAQFHWSRQRSQDVAAGADERDPSVGGKSRRRASGAYNPTSAPIRKGAGLPADG